MGDGAAPFSNAGYEGEDRISALHDDLLCAIISRLPVTDAARTATLASRWRHIWRSTPLVLDDAHLPEHSRAAAVSLILTDHPGPFDTVFLSHCTFAYQDPQLAEWARLLAAKGTRKVGAANGTNLPILARLPADILRCTSLRALLLDGWMFPANLSRDANIILPHLRTLSMTEIGMSNQDLEYLIAACPVLETLALALDSMQPRLHLHGQSIRCALLWLPRVEHFLVVDAPLLERLVFFLLHNGVTVKIAGATNLRVLGNLDTGAHKLHIGESLIGPNTMVSPNILVPSVKILAVTVNFGVLGEVKMLASFLRCFPNIHTLHIESVTSNEPIGLRQAKFWQEVSPVECLRSHVSKMVIHKFRGDQNEFGFLKFIAIDAQELQSLMVVSQEDNFSSTDMVNEITHKLHCLRFRTGISGCLLVLPEVGFDSRVHKALHLTVDDPFCY